MAACLRAFALALLAVTAAAASGQAKTTVPPASTSGPAKPSPPAGQPAQTKAAPPSTAPSSTAASQAKTPAASNPPSSTPANPISRGDEGSGSAALPPAVPVRTETGTLDGASFRIDIPQNWNRGLVLYFHGYMARPQVFDPKYPPSRVLEEILNRGYAVARSGYSAGGWAVPQAAADTDAVRRYFHRKYGAPREIFLMGHSMGGLLTLMTIEQDPKNYAGGLALCGVMAPADMMMQRAFANRVAFDAFFPGVLPDVNAIPPSFMMNDIPTITAVQKSLDANPKMAAIVRDLADIHTNRALADVLVFNTFVIEDLRLKSGGNPFDNRNLIYTGTDNDPLLNQRVHRYAADPNAYRFLSSWYSPTGNLRRKLLEVHTIYDPLVPAANTAWYDELTRRMATGADFVQQYVDRDGHCNITAAQTGMAFDELVNWVHNNQRPTPGLLPGSPPPPVQAPPKPKNPGKPE